MAKLSNDPAQRTLISSFTLNALFGTSGRRPATAEAALLLLRLHIGVSVCLGAGWSKLFPSPGEDGSPTPTPPPWFVEQVANMGFPQPEVWAMAAIVAEVIGGALLALGLLTRGAGLLIAVHFAVAAFMFHKVLPIRDINIAQLYLWASLLFVGLGAGPISLDRVIQWIIGRGRGASS